MRFAQQPDSLRVTKRVVWLCETGLFALRNGLFGTAKEPVSQDGLPRAAKQCLRGRFLVAYFELRQDVGRSA